MEKVIIFCTALFLIVFFASRSLINSANAAEQKEMYMANEAGGYVILTLEPCEFPGPDKHYPYRAYATEGNTLQHEGCWDRTNIEDAPKSPNIKIIPLVNTWWSETNGLTLSIPAELFKPEKESLDFKGDI